MKSTKVVIFDWNRTLYDPERQKLLPEALNLCRKLSVNGIILVIISRGEPERKREIAASALAQYIFAISVEKEKSLRQFRRILRKFPATLTFVVGDRVNEEIRMGNRLGLTTIWLQKGKFRKEVPQNNAQLPSFTIKSLAEVWPIVSPNGED